MFLNDAWYVVAWSRDLGDAPVAITVLNQPVVVFRDPDGRASVLEDRCPHRHVPLSLGCRDPKGLRCGYHGMVFDRDGQCVEVPSQSAIPPRAKVRAYPAKERYGWIWAWMGAHEAADANLIPDFSRLVDSDLATVGKTNHVKANYQLVTDNLMDLNHVGYVHQSTIGNPEFTETGKLVSKRTDNGVRVMRVSPNVPPPPTYVLSGALPEGEKIDRWQVIDFVPPCFVLIHVGGKAAGTGALDGDYSGGLNMWVMNAMTPETANTTNYFWGNVRNYKVGDAQADALFLAQVGAAFEEDKTMLEAQQRILDGRSDTWDLALRADAGSIESRRLLQSRIDAEQAAHAR